MAGPSCVKRASCRVGHSREQPHLGTPEYASLDFEDAAGGHRGEGALIRGGPRVRAARAVQREVTARLGLTVGSAQAVEACEIWTYPGCRRAGAPGGGA